MVKREEVKLTVSQCKSSDWCIGYNEAVDSVYDSIGSCGECEKADIRIGTTVGCCLHQIPTDKDFFCADFERK